jgi:uroporphyrinogen-III synthase
MARQSRPTVLLTRPLAQGARFAAAVAQRFPDLPIVSAPLLAPVFLSPPLPPVEFAGLILTSETGAQGARRFLADGVALPKRAWCVGDQTAAAATAAGFDAESARGDAAALVALIKAQKARPPLLHLRGRDSRGDIADTLNSAGIETHSAIVYAQEPCDLTPQAQAILAGDAPVIVPLFSPRTAALFAAVPDLNAPLWVVALSPTVAQALANLPVARLVTATKPDAAAMITAMATFFPTNA